MLLQRLVQVVFVLYFYGTLSTAMECTTTSLSQVSQVRYERIMSTTSYGCGFLWASRCRRTRYRAISLIVYQLQPSATVTQCCAGFERSESGTCTPVCRGCENPRYCDEPDSCICIDNGYSGTNCDTPICLNCASPRVCTAPETCQCHSGLTGPTCEDDINECESLGRDTGCEQICVNTQRSYKCACEEGFTLGDDGGRCVGSVNISVLAVDSSSSLVAVWAQPNWDTEKLTTAYIVRCWNSTHTMSATVLNGTSTLDNSSNMQQGFELSTDNSSKCCITVMTQNGNGPESCTTFIPPTTTLILLTTTESKSEGTVSSVGNRTGAQGDSSIWNRVGFKIGVAVAGACIVMVIIVCVLVGCCTCCRSKHKQKMVMSGMPTTVYRPILPRPRTDTSATQRDCKNELYELRQHEEVRIKSIDEDDDDDEGMTYNEIYHGNLPKRVNTYEESTHYHYIT